MSETSTPATPPEGQPRRQRRRRSQGSRPDSHYTHRNQAVHVPDGYMAVGRVVGMHGLNGELRVELHTDFPERFAPGGVLFLGAGLTPLNIEGAREHKGMILLTLEGIADRDAAENLRNEWLFIPDSEAMDLPAGEYWVHEIIGLAVVDENGGAVGQVSDVMQTGANDVYIITPAGAVNRGKELLIPATAEVVQRVDLESKTLTIRLIPGLLDE